MGTCAYAAPCAAIVWTEDGAHGFCRRTRSTAARSSGTSSTFSFFLVESGPWRIHRLWRLAHEPRPLSFDRANGPAAHADVRAAVNDGISTNTAPTNRILSPTDHTSCSSTDRGAPTYLAAGAGALFAGICRRCLPRVCSVACRRPAPDIASPTARCRRDFRDPKRTDPNRDGAPVVASPADRDGGESNWLRLGHSPDATEF